MEVIVERDGDEDIAVVLDVGAAVREWKETIHAACNSFGSGPPAAGDEVVIPDEARSWDLLVDGDVLDEDTVYDGFPTRVHWRLRHKFVLQCQVVREARARARATPSPRPGVGGVLTDPGASVEVIFYGELEMAAADASLARLQRVTACDVLPAGCVCICASAVVRALFQRADAEHRGGDTSALARVDAECAASIRKGLVPCEVMRPLCSILLEQRHGDRMHQTLQALVDEGGPLWMSGATKRSLLRPAIAAGHGPQFVGALVAAGEAMNSDYKQRSPAYFAATRLIGGPSAAQDDWEALIRTMIRLAAVDAPSNTKHIERFVNVSEHTISPLMFAATAGRAALCGVLLDSGAAVLARCPEYRTALHYAVGVRGGGEDVCEMLLTHERALDHTRELLVAKNEHGKTAFMIALEAASSVGAASGCWQRMLHAASTRGDPSLVAALVTKGCINGRTPLHYAAGCAAAVTALLAHAADANATSYDAVPVLTSAVEAGALDVCTLLLRAGADPNPQPDGFGMTPLLMAARLDCTCTPSIVTALLKAGASPHVHVAEPFAAQGVRWGLAVGSSVLVAAAKVAGKQGAAVASVLLSRGGVCADDGGSGGGRRTPLSYAAENGDVGLCEVLLAHGASVDGVDSATGRTPLMFAAGRGKRAACEVLIAAGASVAVRCNARRSVATYARRGGLDDAVVAGPKSAGQQQAERGRAKRRSSTPSGDTPATEPPMRRRRVWPATAPGPQMCGGT